MSNPFEDIECFGSAGEQATSEANYKMYLDLIREETDELEVAIQDNDQVEQLDALVDILVVTMGAIRAAGWDGQGAWKEVMDTNFAKIDPTTGKVIKREDGKVLKPSNWSPPNLAQFIK